MYPARTRFHRGREPGSADHNGRILKNVGVARLEFSATYWMRKSFERIAASIAPFAAATTASNEYAEVRALSTSSGRLRRTPITDAMSPYTASPNPRTSAKVPSRSMRAALPVPRQVRRVRSPPWRRRRVHPVVLHQDGVGMEDPV